MSSLALDAALARHRREHDRYLQVADAVASRCRRLADEASIRASVQGRVKSPECVRAKLERLTTSTAIGADTAALGALGDLAGVRVATFAEAGREPMVAAIQSAFPEVDVEVKDRPDSFYRGTHCQNGFAREEVSICSAENPAATRKGTEKSPVNAHAPARIALLRPLLC